MRGWRSGIFGLLGEKELGIQTYGWREMGAQIPGSQGEGLLGLKEEGVGGRDSCFLNSVLLRSKRDPSSTWQPLRDSEKPPWQGSFFHPC